MMKGRSPRYDEYGSLCVLNGQEGNVSTDVEAAAEFEMWLRPDEGKGLSKQAKADLKRQLPDFDVSADRTDFASGMGETLGPVQNVLLVISVLIGVLVLKAPFVSELMFDAVSSPQVPFTAVIAGMLVSIGVGALAGLIPAIVATKVRIIDAIRA